MISWVVAVESHSCFQLGAQLNRLAFGACSFYLVLQLKVPLSPPATVRIRNFLDNAYVFIGLYVTTFLSVSSAFSLIHRLN